MHNIIILFAILFFSNTFFATSSNIDSQDPILSEIIPQSDIYNHQKLTPSPNEHVDLFSGTLKLHYTDFSAPVAPGLNLEFNRAYSSGNYGNDVFDYHRHYDQQTVSQLWNFQSDYIRVDRGHCKEKVINNMCKPVYISSKGEKIVLYADKDNVNKFRTINNWRGEIANGIYVLTAPNGFKYYFGYYWKLANSHRYNLTKIETPTGQYITYYYDKALLSEIRTSNPGQVLKILNKEYHIKKISYGTKTHFYVPDSLYFNGQKVAQYGYAFLYKDDQLILTRADLTGGKYWIYNYGIMYVPMRQEYLLGVKDNSSATKYSYNLDMELRIARTAYATRLIGINRQETNGESGDWSIGFAPGGLYDGVRTKVVTVKNNYFTTINKYFAHQNNNVWRAGYIINNTIYKNNVINDNNILQKTDYQWQKAFHNQYQNKLVIHYPHENKKHESDKIDSQTYRAQIASIQLKRDNDLYKTEYFDYDDYDNPARIIQSNKDQSREIRSEFLNIIDKNILGLRTSTAINNKIIEKREFDNFGNMIYSSIFNKNYTFTYDQGLLSSKTDNLGNTVLFNNYYAGVAQGITYPDGTKENKTITPIGLPSSKTNARGYITDYSYDVFGQIVKETPASGLPKIYSHLGNTTILSHGNYKEEVISNSYDLPVKQVLGSNKIINSNYDALGRKTFESSPYTHNLGKYYSYDSLNRLISECASKEDKDKSNCTKYDYLPNNTTAINYPSGEYKIISKISYGELDGKIININDGGRETRIARDLLGYVTSVTQGNTTKNYYYDKDYNLIKYTEPETGATEFNYDKMGNMLQKRQNTNITDYVYNQKNYKLQKIKYSDSSPTVEYNYDVNGSLTKASKGKIIWDYKYDELDRLITEELTVNQSCFDKTNINKSKNKDCIQKFLLDYYYNPKGDLEKMVYPDDSIILLDPNEYGEATRLGDYVTNISYHNNSHWQKLTYNNKISASTSVDSYNRVNQYNYGAMQLNYLYDLDNNLLALNMIDTKEQDFHHAYNFSYDKAGRISHTKINNGELSYSYDDNDNIKSIQSSLKSKNNQNNLSPVSGSSLLLDYSDMQLRSITVNTPGAAGLTGITSQKLAYGYDNMGNIKADSYNKYIYGVDNNLQATTGQHYGNYEYDYNQQRILQENKTIYGDSQTITFYNKAGLALYEYNLAEQKGSKYLYLDNQRVAKVDHNDEVSFYFNDAQGSPIAQVDKAGTILWREAYLPFGVKLLNTSGSTGNKFGYVGKEVDSNGLGYFGARYYNPTSGRFMSPDPAAVEPENPFSFNRYSYGNNNPYKYVDRDGRNPMVILATQASIGGMVGLSGALLAGERDTQNLISATALGAVSGLTLSLKTGTIAKTAITAGWGSVAGDIALKELTGEQISPTSLISSFCWGAVGGAIGHKIAYTKVPVRNLPASNGTISPFTKTIREMKYPSSEYNDAPRRLMYESVFGPTLGLAAEHTSLYAWNRMYN
ncbi:MAG: RHS repeat-associated core domain-containing protein [Gammaproteobacteria bacterium]|nr:RHS repeat-associated core domain-containing protein [Gammaproteobacteria bacterium]